MKLPKAAKQRIFFCGVLCAVVTLCADIRITSPQEGETVSQLWPDQKEFLETPLEKRISGARTDAESAGVKSKRMRRKRTAMPVHLEWTGDAALFSVTVAREPDGKVFFSANVTSSYVEVTGLLEMARKWKWTVSDGTSSASGSFSTEDYAPRILNWPGVSNVRDIGGRIGLNGRRVKQGLVFRSGGLNNNAKIEYYNYDEILAMHKAGTLAKAGAGASRHLGPAYEARLSNGKGIDRHFLRLIKAPPSVPGDPKLTDESRAYILEKFGIKTDLDFRSDWECYGMTGSPLGEDVTWCHYPCRAGYGGFVTPLGRATAAEAFSLLVDKKNYPIVFHCIGGTDRTGTFAYLLNGLLGVAEDELILDYDISFMGGQGPDARHRSWQSGLTNAVRKLPGDTLAEKLKQYFISLGFTEEEVEGVREFLLEPR